MKSLLIVFEIRGIKTESSFKLNVMFEIFGSKLLIEISFKLVFPILN